MKILLNDIIQFSDAPRELKSPMLSDYADITTPLVINFDKERRVNAVGIGNTDGTMFSINGEAVHFSGNGLYMLCNEIKVSQIIIETDAAYIGRVAAGIGVNIPTSIAKAPGYNSTSVPRYTLSGQVIPGAGGYNYKSVSLDSRYKIDEKMMRELKEGYSFIGMGYPFFINLTTEAYKLPFERLYATERNQLNMVFESGVRRFLYSKRWEFEERF